MDKNTAYRALYDDLSDMIEGGRLTEDMIPDDYQSLLLRMEACQAAEGHGSNFPTFAKGDRVIHPMSGLTGVVMDPASEETCVEVRWDGGIGIDHASGCGPEEWVMRDELQPSRECVHCHREVLPTKDGVWIDPEATGDDEVWRETCDSNEAFDAPHEV